MSARTVILLAAVALGACSHGGPRVEVPQAAPPSALSASLLTPRQKAFHLLSRFAFGPRPGEVEALASKGDAGLVAWLSTQLEPRVPERELDVKLSSFPTLALSVRELQLAYPSPDQAAKERGLDANPDTRRQMEVLLTKDHLPPRIEQELVAQKLERAVESERQLEEVLVDFWFNHFNVDQSKGEDRWMVTSYERDAIRPHVLGKFRELLEATATHPAMLYYLDNWLSVRDEPEPLPGQKPKNPNRPKRGLNENYGRELLELHTLGVEGGYSQTDVREVARCFTGWTIEEPQKAARFAFHPKDHDAGVKHVLGVTIAGGGRDDGERVLDIVARHPATARFIATKLARRFVSDDPPPALVERLARTFTETDGDLKALLVALFESPETWSHDAYRSKIKTPFEFAVSAVRALGGHVDNAGGLAGALGKMGQPLYRCQPPTGYKDSPTLWVNTGALIARLNFGLALAQGKLGGTHVHVQPLAAELFSPDPTPALTRASLLVLHDELAPGTREVILAELKGEDRAMADGEVRQLDLPRVVGMLLGSPEFQRR